ncbi:MAG: signal peptidase I [Alistipes sp.]|jgi:signal peptidase I|nr:signal peptidase I [Alistipes sp.]
MVFLKNKWARFGIWTFLYVLIFVVWMCNGWMLLGIPVLFDLFITKYFSRYVLKYHRSARERSGMYNLVAEWIEAIVFAVVMASLIHIFVFQMFVIPSPSMEKSLLVGDYLYVSKVTYGPKMPNTPLSMPLVHNTMPFSEAGAKSYSEVIRRPYKRLAGLRPIERDDVVVFNFPAGDTVLLEDLNVTYYDVLRSYQRQLGAAQGRALLESRYTIVARPVDKRENYVKRCVGLPGDTICIVASLLYVNGLAQKEISGLQQVYRIVTSAPFSHVVLDNMGITINPEDYDRLTGEYWMPLTDVNVQKMRSASNVVSVEKIGSVSGDVFPNIGITGWTESDFGPLWIPSRGVTVTLTLDNLPLYERIIDVYEANDLEVRDGQIYINGAPANDYTFRMDYYWMMGDNRQNSADSRFWGFVPEDHIVGKASFVWLSLDKDKGLFDGKIRWNRMFRKIR